MNLLGQPAYVGRHCGANEYEVTREVVDFYADALDDHSPLYSEVAPPLLHHSECYKFVGEWYLKNLFGNLHAQQDWELFAPIPIGARVRTRSTIIDRYQKRGRDYVVNETDLVRRRRRAPARARAAPTSRSCRRSDGAASRGGFVVDESTAERSRSPAPAVPDRDRPRSRPGEEDRRPRRCWMFSGPGKNYHTDRGAGARSSASRTSWCRG